MAKIEVTVQVSAERFRRLRCAAERGGLSPGAPRTRVIAWHLERAARSKKNGAV